MLLEHLLPRVEYWVESEMRGRLRSCQWAQEEWRKGGRGLRNIAREKWAKDARNTVGVGEATGWAMGGWNWVSGMFGGGAKKTLNPIGKREREVRLTLFFRVVAHGFGIVSSYSHFTSTNRFSDSLFNSPALDIPSFETPLTSFNRFFSSSLSFERYCL